MVLGAWGLLGGVPPVNRNSSRGYTSSAMKKEPFPRDAPHTSRKTAALLPLHPTPPSGCERGSSDSNSRGCEGACESIISDPVLFSLRVRGGVTSCIPNAACV